MALEPGTTLGRYEIIASLGYAQNVVDSEYWLTAQGAGASRVRFVFRQSTQFLIPQASPPSAS